MMRGAGLSSRKSEFILNVSLCVCVCVCVFFRVVLSSREFLFRYLDTEDWKIELIVPKGFNFFSFFRNRLNDFYESKSIFIILSFI